jgi:hypothetical protein
MTRTSILGASLLGLALSNAALAKKSTAPSSDWDPAATTALKAMSEKMFQDMDAGNMEAMTAMMSSEGVVFDMDMNNNPVAKRGPEVAAYLNEMGAMMKQNGSTMKTSIVRDDCFATAVMGYCAIEFDQTFTMGAQVMGPVKFRGTAVARKVGETWKWEHWHGSFREMPVMTAPESAEVPPAAPAPTTPAKK